MQAELDKVIGAIREFYAREGFLLDKDFGERTLTHRMAVHIERQFDGWEVDCDYNRLGERLLKLPHESIVSTDDGLGKSIFPDIVVHRRAIPENLLAIEVRKEINHQPAEHDHHKLRGLTDPHVWFAYRLGVFLILGKSQVKESSVYLGGVIEPALSNWFAGRLRDTGLGA
jgi:hypothetical protein